MFDKNFFPSPEKVIDLLLENVNAIGCKRILEPSAGKGDLVKGIQNKTHQREITIDVIEKNEDLCAILQSKGLAVVANDFLEFNTNTEYSHIIMNPPFDTGDKHLLHAIELAERQIEPCAISCILNANTLENTYSDSRKALLSKIELYGGVITYHDNLFSEAERKTNVRCAVVSLTANAVSAEVKFNYSKLIDDLDFSKDEQLERSLSTTIANNEIGERVADIKRYVSQYARHVELIKDMYIAKKSINYFENISDIDSSTYIRIDTGYDEVLCGLRRDYWGLILQTKEFEKMLTSHGRDQLHKQLSVVSETEINDYNIKLLLLAISQNQQSMILDSAVDLFEKFTSRHQKKYSSNIHYYNGWKTNDAFKVNKKIIVQISPLGFTPWDLGKSYDKLSYSIREFISDIVKCFRNLDETISYDFVSVADNEFENNFIKFKVMKKGTIHIWFKDQGLLEKFNFICGQNFNWVPSDDEIKSNRDAKEFVFNNFDQESNLLEVIK